MIRWVNKTLLMTFKLTETHWALLLDFMESHKSFALGRFSGPAGKATQRALWEELSTLLNPLGCGSKSVEKWQKTWADIKYAIKKKAATNQRQAVCTGGGPKVVKDLNKWEERVVGILGKTFHEGVGVPESGLPQTAVNLEVLEVIEDKNNKEVHNHPQFFDVIPSTSSGLSQQEPEMYSILPPTDEHTYTNLGVGKGKKRKSQTSLEDDILRESTDELKKIRLELREVNKNLGDISATLKEILALYL